MTFIASASAIHWSGAAPWLMDVDSLSWTLDPVQFERVLSTKCERRGGETFHIESGRRVSAVVPVYTLGAPADMDAIVPVAHAHGLKVVADAAAAIGATYKGRPLASSGPDLGMISFNGNKTVTAGGGGAVFGTDEDLVARTRHLTTTAAGRGGLPARRDRLQLPHDQLAGGGGLRADGAMAGVRRAQAGDPRGLRRGAGGAAGRDAVPPAGLGGERLLVLRLRAGRAGRGGGRRDHRRLARAGRGRASVLAALCICSRP
jgi:hypothetical protein